MEAAVVVACRVLTSSAATTTAKTTTSSSLVLDSIKSSLLASVLVDVVNDGRAPAPPMLVIRKTYKDLKIQNDLRGNVDHF